MMRPLTVEAGAAHRAGIVAPLCVAAPASNQLSAVRLFVQPIRLVGRVPGDASGPKVGNHIGLLGSAAPDFIKWD
jgi:hypothetical protein